MALGGVRRNDLGNDKAGLRIEAFSGKARGRPPPPSKLHTPRAGAGGEVAPAPPASTARQHRPPLFCAALSKGSASLKGRNA